MGQIFMGAGEHSMAKCYELHQKLDIALGILGGIQQPCRCDRPCDCAEAVRLAQGDVESLARDIYESLTGDKIEYA